MTTVPRPWAVLPAVIGVYWAAVAALVVAGLARTAGTLVYPLDDTYVHMAMAKHAALDGVWGVTAERFTSASSSPLWTGLLTVVYSVAGVSNWAPLLLNVIAGTALLWSVDRLLGAHGLSTRARAMVLAAVVLAGTLPTLTVLGMEHTLHALVSVWFVVLGVRVAARGAEAGPDWLLASLAGVLTVTRYEGMFAVAAVVVLLALMRRWRTGVLVASAGAATVLAYGLWAQSHGAFLLPNSVLLKGVTPTASATGLLQTVTLWPAWSGLGTTPHLAFLVVTALGLAALVRPGPATFEWRAMAMVFTACVLLHLEFARAGWFYRYETYLVVLGVVVVGLMASSIDWAALQPDWGSWPVRLSVGVLAVLLAFPLVRRGVNAVRDTPDAVANIYEQQYQVGLFLDEYYRGQRVAVNDVGAVGYFANVRLLDLWGLASSEIAELKRQGRYSSATVAELAARDAVEIAVIYPSWLGEYGGVPSAWQKVGEWRVANNVVLGENGVSFYTVAPESRGRLVESLAAYAGRLPAGVMQEGAYRAGH